MPATSTASDAVPRVRIEGHGSAEAGPAVAGVGPGAGGARPAALCQGASIQLTLPARANVRTHVVKACNSAGPKGPLM